MTILIDATRNSSSQEGVGLALKLTCGGGHADDWS